MSSHPVTLPPPGPIHGPDRPAEDAVREMLGRIGALGADETDRIDLGRAALFLAVLEKPGADIAPYQRHLDRLAREIGDYAGVGAEFSTAHKPDLSLMIEALDQVFVKRYGYGGTRDSFYDPDGANMMAVIDNRAGLPVMLGAILIDVCRKLGWSMSGVNFPARFLVRLEAHGVRAVLDPFENLKRLNAGDLRTLHKGFAGKGAELRPHHYQDADARAVLLRILNNIKTRTLKEERFTDALDAIDTMSLLAPGEPKLWREAGLLHARLDDVPAAVAALEEYLKYETVDADLYKTSLLLQDLRGRLD